MAKKHVKKKRLKETLVCQIVANKIEKVLLSQQKTNTVVLGLILPEIASDKFEERKKELIAEWQRKVVEMKDFLRYETCVSYLRRKFLR